MKRPKAESKQMDDTIRALFKAHPEAQEVKNRYRSLRALLKKKYNFGEMSDTIIEAMLKDCVSYDRKIRLWTEHLEQPLKKELSDQYIVDELL